MDFRFTVRSRAVVTAYFGIAMAFSVGSAQMAYAQSNAQTNPSAVHGLSMYGELKYGTDFKNFAYVNPAAPKGGVVTLKARGTFDTLNSFNIKGTPAAGVSLIYNSLMSHAADEAFAMYGELAQTAQMPDDRSSVIFNLHDNARWHDGREVTADDVVFTFELLKTKGRPIYRHYYANVARAEKLGPKKIKFHFSGPKNRELPLIIAEMIVLPKHYWQNRNFSATTLEPPLGSGPYRIKKVVPGRSISLERVGNYWGRKVPSQVGRYNYGTIRYEYFRDDTIALEAFKSGTYDFQREGSSKRWATEYGKTFKALQKGWVKKELIPNGNTQGMQGFIMNTRRALFADRNVRAALTLAMDFEWMNKNLFHGQYVRHNSFFDNSDLTSRGLPDARELKLLEPLKGQIPAEVFSKTYRAPSTKGPAGIRGNLRQARKILQNAGWRIRNGWLTNAAGATFDFEILLVQRDFERVTAPFAANLKRLGIKAKLRIIDVSQYINRLRDFDFDMIVSGWGQSNSPGNEQRGYWSTQAADQPGGRNYIGIKNPAIDKLIEHVIFADSRADLVAATRALDRVLLWGHYVIPQWYIASDRVAYWNRFSRPKLKPLYGIGFIDTWWIDKAKDAALAKARGRN